jgi:hypothetical protein
MYVGVLHTVTDKDVWAKGLAAFENAELPEGFSNPISYMGAETDYAFCLWDVPSLEALQPMLDEATKGGATNMYFRVDPAAFGTAGIPAQRIDLDTKTATTR